MAVELDQQVDNIAPSIGLFCTRHCAQLLQQALKMRFQAGCVAKTGYQSVEHGLENQACLTGANVIRGLPL